MNIFLRFLITGGTGAVLSLLTTWVLTHYFFGEAHYMSAYVVGIAVNLLFNFVAYTLAVFQTKQDHVRRLLIFVFYGIIMALLQGSTVALITSAVGTGYYLFVIACVIAFFSLFNFSIFKLSIFKERAHKEKASPRAILTFIIVCATLLKLAVAFHVLAIGGNKPFVYGDAVSYIELAHHIQIGEGFASSRATGVLQDEVFRTPGLPLLLAPFSANETSLTWYFVLLALVSGILLPYFIFGVASYFVSPVTGLVAATLVAFEPHLVFFSMLPQTETPFMLFSYGALLATLYAHRENKLLFSVFGGILFGYSVLIRPGFLPTFVVALTLTIGYFAWQKLSLKHLGALLIGLLALLSPWYIRTHAITGVYSLSGAGWRNVYTDYLASVRAIEHHTDFSSEKRNLKDQSEEAGVPTQQIDNPAYGKKLRDYSLKELWLHKTTVLKLEPVLIFSYFTQDGYYYQFERFLLIPPDDGSPHISPTFLLLHKGFAAVPDVLHELSRQLFIPIVGRIFTIGMFLLSLCGFFLTKHKFRFVFLVVIALSALTSTVIGLGVEARLRLPVEPILYIFAAVSLTQGISWLHRRHEA